MKPYWVSLIPWDHKGVEDIRLSVWDELGPDPERTEKIRPHLTLHPGFTCDRQTASVIGSIATGAIGTTIESEGVEYWPDAYDAKVVMLRVSANIAGYQKAISDRLEQNGGTIDRDPVDAHITLFKTGDVGEDPRPMDIPTGKAIDWKGRFSDWESEVKGAKVMRR